MSHTSYKGKLLISNSTIVTDDFNKSVVLMIEHDPMGAFGLVINKQSRLVLNEVIMGLPSEVAGLKNMNWGGPVDHSFVTILHTQTDIPDPGIEVIPNVYLSRSYDLLMKLLILNFKNFSVFHGYSGWGAMQLESEFSRKSWVAIDPKPDFFFHEDSESVWREALKSQGGIYKYFAEHIKDPMLN